MKKNYILILLLIIFTIQLFSTSYNTIAIDGNNSGWAADETFTNISHDNNTGSAPNAYFTWDADFIYIGVSDDEADYGNLATFIYFDTDPTGSNGTTDSYAWTDYVTTPFNSDWVIVLKNESGNDYIEVRQYNNSTLQWDQIHSESALFVYSAPDTLVKFAVGVDYREFKIKRSLLGSPDAIKTCMFTEQQWDSYWRYLVWPSDGWVDAGRAFGQAIPNYYGFILEDNVVPYSAPYFNANITGWTGASSNIWATDGNWSGGIAPDQNTLVMLPASATVSVDASSATCYDMSITSGGVLSIAVGGDLTITGNLYNHTGNAGVVIQSNASGNGSLIYNGSNSSQATIQNYVTAGQWHSWSAPVPGLTAFELYLNASPEVYLMEYDESTKTYSYISAFTEPLGNMKGWMLWVDGSGSNIYNFTGQIRTELLGTDNNMIRSATGDYGFNYIGNPYSSAIDWDASSGWTKTNINNAIYVYNNGGWATYISGTGTNSGSQYISMNQGFFVQVTDGLATYPEYGTLKMDNDVCVHNSVDYLKNSNNDTDSLFRLQLTQNDITDDAVIRLKPDATEGFDGQWDAVKFFSYSNNRPLIYSTANNGMAINTLPPTTEIIPVDVKGIDGIEMTISMTEVYDFTDVYLLDDLTGTEINLSQEDYSFIYDQNFINRFTIHFTITDIEDISDSFDFHAYSVNNTIKIHFDDQDSHNVRVINMLGQNIFNSNNIVGHTEINYIESGIYIIEIASDNGYAVKKVVVN